MASIRKRGSSWVADVCVDRKRRSKSFTTKRASVAWANEQEENGILAHHTLRQAIERYKPIAESHKGALSELSRLSSMHEAKFIDTPLEYITPAMISEYRDARLIKLAPVSVRRELIILSSLFNVAAKEWGWVRGNPVSEIVKPATSKPRRRGITQNEIDQITANLLNMRVGKQVAAMFHLSIETAMRQGELCALKWSDVSDKTLTLVDTKNGDTRAVPLSPRARELIGERRGIDPDVVFTLNAHVVSTTFRRATINGAHFHDARSEAITRLSKKLDVMQLAKMIGRRDIKSLMIYYAETAEAIADRL